MTASRNLSRPSIVALALLLAAGSARADFEPYNPGTGYCGPSGFSLPAYTDIFNPACYEHDKCYNQCKNTGNSKERCDLDFLYAMRKICDDTWWPTQANRDTCKAAAATHYQAVKTGASHFPAYNCTAADLAAITPTVDLKINGGPGPATIQPGGAVTLQWTAKYVAECTGYGNWSGNKAAGGGTQVVHPRLPHEIYYLNCRNSGGASATTSVEVRVGAGGGLGGGGGTAPVVELTINGATGTVAVPEWDEFTLTWSSRNTATCEASGGWYGTRRAGGGSEKQGPIAATTSYTLTCRNSAGVRDTKTVTARLVPAGGGGGAGSAPVVELRINGSMQGATVGAGTTATLAWTVRGATACTASGGWTGGRSAGSGSERVGPIAASTTYTLTCRDAANRTAVKSVRATVTAAPQLVDLTVDGVAGPVSIPAGGRVTLAWTTRNAVVCTASDGWSGRKDAGGGTYRSIPLYANKTYTLTCKDAASKSMTKNVRVIVATTGR